MTGFVLFCLLFTVSETELLPLNETVLLSDAEIKGDDLSVLYESSELVFSVRSVTRKLSILGWASERYDLKVGEVLKGDLFLERVNFYTIPCGIYSRQFSTLQEDKVLIVFATPDSANLCMEGFNTAEESWIGYLYIQ